MKVAVITCYFDPDYVRSRSLRAALKSLPGVEVVVVKNHRRSVLRYFEMSLRLIRMRLRDKPDVYMLTFRGYEMLPLTLLLAGKRPVVFDEFIPLLAWTHEKNRRMSLSVFLKYVLIRSVAPLYNHWLKRCRVILADTTVHADISSHATGVDRAHYLPVPVGTDEYIFKPLSIAREAKRTNFTVFYYGNMLPLHGLGFVLEAAAILKDKPAINFLIVGGGRQTERIVKAASEAGAHVHYRTWVPFDELPHTIQQVDLCLGGPFGNTSQAHRVITGKTYQFLACAMPTIVGQNAVSEALFTHEYDSLVVPQADPEALARAIRWAYTNRVTLPAMGKAGRALYEDKFSNVVIAKLLAQLLAGIDADADNL
jgi:glycosyltransferase involved in cell wall biosynthesis